MIIGECREKLIHWWEELTNDQKKKVPINRNKIDLRDFFIGSELNYFKIRKYLKEDINKIEKELKQLGVLFNDDNMVIEALMREFISACKANSELLWDVELSMLYGRKYLKYGEQEIDKFYEKFGLVSTKYLASKLSCKPKNLETPTMIDLRIQLNQLLLKHKVSLPYNKIKDSSHSVGYDLNNRRVFLQWKNNLTEKQKLEIPLFGNLIDQKSFSHLIPTKRNATNLPLLKHEYQNFSQEIVLLKDIDYKTVKEREKTRKKLALDREEGKLKVFGQLRVKKLVSVDDFCSEKGRYEDVQHAFAIGSLKASSKSGISNYYIGYKHYCDFLESKGVSQDSSFKDCFDSWSLRNFKEYLGGKVSEGILKTGSASTTLSALRMTLTRLKTVRDFDFNFLPADGFEIVGESLAYKSYSPNERLQIQKMLDREMHLVKKKLNPYEKLDRSNANLDDPKIQARIIFEDDCNCIPTYMGNWATKERTKGQNKLVSFVRTRRISLPDLYDEWGVLTRKVTSREVGVYVLKMAQVLGLNLNPILDLDIDDYQQHHPLTNKPCLTYWKERSTGEKMLHLDLFHADLQWLTVSQKNFVESVFDDIIQLTTYARKFVPSNISNKLFINFVTTPKVVTDSTMSKLYSELVEEYQLKSDSGAPLVLTTTRFRPTLVSELIEAGISIREIQYLLGHSTIYTTIKYIEQLDLERIIRDKARKAIEDIYKNTIQGNNKNSVQITQRKYDDSLIIMKTPLGGCKNIFNPPDFIKNSSLYVKGVPCSQYNKCLSCDNVMLTEKHLPELFAMQRDYLSSIENSVVINTPYHIVVLENLSLLDDILNPETSEFTEDILIQAKEDSIFLETTILDSWGA
ncbi:tyrosine-type recombinase/integrase [Vibrio splendidus]|uniref:Tyrosine-type recombinase/integrase n=1 Tax=Vibrio splendidus TaxID=29497 RepID=A0ABD5A9Q1_VIBSP|nr:tyrosine-type recombinase/integrase [Vibrio splendidus]MDP2489966.1 tyrosine-type recombinase/integrase [Vibrio splendidus]